MPARALLTWIQQSDADVVCIIDQRGPVTLDIGCTNTEMGAQYRVLPRPEQADIDDAYWPRVGDQFSIAEWRTRGSDPGRLGVYGPITLGAYHVLAFPLVAAP